MPPLKHSKVNPFSQSVGQINIFHTSKADGNLRKVQCSKRVKVLEELNLFVVQGKTE